MAKKKTKTIAIDFDGVIHGYSQGWSDGTIYDPPVPGTKEALEQLKASGHKLYIFTTRTNKAFRKKDDPDQALAIKEWMDTHQLPYDRIWTFGKPMADIYIDDRAVEFRGNWEETLQKVESFHTWIGERKEEE